MPKLKNKYYIVCKMFCVDNFVLFNYLKIIDL